MDAVEALIKPGSTRRKKTMSQNVKDFIPRRTSSYVVWLKNFINVADANLAQTGLTAGQLAALNDLFTTLATTWTAQRTALRVAKSATLTKDAAVVDSVISVRALARVVQAHPGATDQLKVQMGLTVHDRSRAPVPVYPPSNLTASLDPQLQIKLIWDRNGNKPGTTYILEMRQGDDGPWGFVAAVTRTRYVDAGRPAGVHIQYRVHAVRANRASLYSEPASVYAPEGQTTSSQPVVDFRRD